MAENYPDWAKDRLLSFINSARAPEAISKSEELKDDPTSGSSDGYTIGNKTAQNILDAKKTLPKKKFNSVEQLLDVQGLGKDKLNDLLKSFSNRADDAFISTLYSKVMGDNWTLSPLIIDYATNEEFEETVKYAENFLRAIGTLYAGTFVDYYPAAQREIEMRVHRAHMENYFDAHLAAFPFAFWWYQFDHDNWFSYQAIKDICEKYLNHHGNGDQMQLRIIHLKGYDSITEQQRGLTLPVVVNFAEKRITLWEAVLND